MTVRIALVGGPMYDPLYETIASFEREHGVTVQVAAQLPHPELNAFVKNAFESAVPLDLISTHTKYAPSQADGLSALDETALAETVRDLLPRLLQLSRIDGELMQIPRNLDVRLLHYRRDLFEDVALSARFEAASGRPLAVPGTWTDLIETAAFFTRALGTTTTPFYGFLFPGRDSGLFGTFYELLVGAGGSLFDASLQPAFDSQPGRWAVERIVEMHLARAITPRELPEWHYDEISAAFREGQAAMVTDWPGSYHLYRDSRTCRVADRLGLALLPVGPADVRAAYAGCHSFAIPRSTPNRTEAMALLQHLTTFDAQLGEARCGSIPARASALRQVRVEAASDGAAAARWELLEQTERAMIIPPRFAAYPQCEDALWRSVQRAMVGEISAAEAVGLAAIEIREIVDRPAE